jgi:DNA invertase Pin-like site-specific DNA recombinase
MSAIVYNRVSSPGQNTYGKNVSLAMQENICNKFAHANKLRVTQIMKEIRSASGKSSPLLKKLIENPRNKNILFMDVSRFSRNVEQGLSLASQAIDNNMKLIFIHEKFACATLLDLPKMKILLLKTEDESKVIGSRITTARNHLRTQGLHPGGSVPYGYELKMSDMGNRPVPNEYEQIIVSFIKICQSNNIQSTDLNTHMKKIVPITMLEEYVNIDCYDDKGDRVQLIDKMDNMSIAALLNDYSITKRGKAWNSSNIKTAMNGEKHVSYKPADTTNVSEVTFNFQSFSTELEDIVVDKPEPTHITTRRRSRKAINNIDSDSSSSPKLRSIRHKSKDSNELISDTELFAEFDSVSDIELFAEFKAFKKLMKHKK